MSVKRSPALAEMLSLSIALLSLTSLPSHAADDDNFDIVGLRLGMSHEQVVEALAAQGIDVESIEETRQYYHYSDGVNHSYRTEDFLASLHASSSSLVGNQTKRDSFTVTFSPPPEGGRAISIRRSLENPIDPPTHQQFRDAVHAKYGAPADYRNGVSKWYFGEGTMDCLPAGSARGILEGVFRHAAGEVYLDQFANARVKSLVECANKLEYFVGAGYGDEQRPATQVRAVMVDVQAWVRAELAANEWVNGLSEEATKAREGQAAQPVL